MQINKEKIKQEYGDITNQPYEFFELLQYIENELSFVTSHYNTDYVKRRIDSRLRRLNLDSYQSYLKILKTNQNEHEKLLNSFNINVTEFFRNPKVWRAIEELLIRICDARSSEINIWSAGCADGREPYSLSMIAHENPKIDEERINIVATDINNESLQKAIAGTYRTTETVDIEDQLGYLNNSYKYITKRNGYFTVKQFIKDNITFEKHDIIREEPKENIDIVICRNLFIYIEQKYELKIINRIADTLNTNGFLILGKAESIHAENKARFNTISTSLRFYQLK